MDNFGFPGVLASGSSHPPGRTDPWRQRVDQDEAAAAAGEELAVPEALELVVLSESPEEDPDELPALAGSFAASPFELPSALTAPERLSVR